MMDCGAERSLVLVRSCYCRNDPARIDNIDRVRHADWPYRLVHLVPALICVEGPSL